MAGLLPLLPGHYPIKVCWVDNTDSFEQTIFYRHHYPELQCHHQAFVRGQFLLPAEVKQENGYQMNI